MDQDCQIDEPEKERQRVDAIESEVFCKKRVRESTIFWALHPDALINGSDLAPRVGKEASRTFSQSRNQNRAQLELPAMNVLKSALFL